MVYDDSLDGTVTPGYSTGSMGVSRKKTRAEGGQELAALALLIGAGVVLLDRRLQLRFASPAAMKLLDCDEDELKRSWPAMAEKLDAGAFSKAQPGGTPVSFDAEFPLRQRRLRLCAEAHALADGYVLAFKERGRIEGADALLLPASQMRTLRYLTSAFVHDVNAPINNLRLTLSLLEATMGSTAGEREERWRRYAAVMKEEVARLSSLVQGLPGLLLCEKTASSGTLDLRQVIEEVSRLTKHEATARGVKRNFKVPAEPVLVQGNRDRLRLALLNLAIVLIESTPAGGAVDLTASCNDDNTHVQLGATSSPPPDCLRTELLTPPVDGDAVGIAAARLIVESHEGSLDCYHEGNIAFRVTLPLHQEA